MNTAGTSFVEAIGREHASLLTDIHDLETAACSTPAEGPEKLAARLGLVRKHIADHFRFEEQGGYMSAVLRIESHLEPEVQRLLEEHHQLAQGLDAILQEVSTAKGPNGIPREKIRAWVKQVRHHESHENRLVQEAFYSSDGTGD